MDKILRNVSPDTVRLYLSTRIAVVPPGETVSLHGPVADSFMRGMPGTWEEVVTAKGEVSAPARSEDPALDPGSHPQDDTPAPSRRGGKRKRT